LFFLGIGYDGLLRLIHIVFSVRFRLSLLGTLKGCICARGGLLPAANPVFRDNVIRQTTARSGGEAYDVDPMRLSKWTRAKRQEFVRRR
jgi:hypothetical protein